jgi:hypothetical protein
MPIFSLAPIVILIVFAVFFYRAGESEGVSGALWAGLSVAISFAVWQWLRWGLFAMILGQVALFVGIGIVRMLRDP